MDPKHSDDEDDIDYPEPPDSSERKRMWASVSFAVMLIVIGIPLWWKTTEVHRAALPYSEINDLNIDSLKILTTILVYTEYPVRTNAIIHELQDALADHDVLNVQIKPHKLELESWNISNLESNTKIHPSTSGVLLILQVPYIEDKINVLVSNHRTIYTTPSTKPNALSLVVKHWLLQEFNLVVKKMSISTPSFIGVNGTERPTQLRASINYNIVLTVVNPNPQLIKFEWDIKSAMNSYMKPLIDQINVVSNHALKSQWLYFVDLNEYPSAHPESKGYVLTQAQLPHIITPLEKKLGSGTSKDPCIHLVLYLAGCTLSPMSMLSSDGEVVKGMISPEWGAVQILNPPPESCASQSTFTASSKDIMTLFVSQFHTLLGIGQPSYPVAEVKLAEKPAPLLRDWELDILIRMRTVEQLTSATITLKSLAKLLGEISNIVINEEVASSISTAVNCIGKAFNALRVGDLKFALQQSQEAYKESETAFSDPSLLALLYFPDDQKYAVYIPLFLPIMIPVLMSLKYIHKWAFSKP